MARAPAAALRIAFSDGFSPSRRGSSTNCEDCSLCDTQPSQICTSTALGTCSNCLPAPACTLDPCSAAERSTSWDLESCRHVLGRGGRGWGNRMGLGIRLQASKYLHWDVYGVCSNAHSQGHNSLTLQVICSSSRRIVYANLHIEYTASQHIHLPQEAQYRPAGARLYA